MTHESIPGSEGGSHEGIFVHFRIRFCTGRVAAFCQSCEPVAVSGGPVECANRDVVGSRDFRRPLVHLGVPITVRSKTAVLPE